MNIWVIILIALGATLFLAALIGLILFTVAQKIRLKALKAHNDVYAAEAQRINDLRDLAREAKLPPSLRLEIDSLILPSADDTAFRSIRNTVDFLSKILARCYKESGQKDKVAAAGKIFDSGEKVYSDYNRSAMTYNSLINIFLVRPYVFFSKSEPLPVY